MIEEASGLHRVNECNIWIALCANMFSIGFIFSCQGGHRKTLYCFSLGHANSTAQDHCAHVPRIDHRQIHCGTVAIFDQSELLPRVPSRDSLSINRMAPGACLIINMQRCLELNEKQAFAIGVTRDSKAQIRYMCNVPVKGLPPTRGLRRRPSVWQLCQERVGFLAHLPLPEAPDDESTLLAYAQNARGHIGCNVTHDVTNTIVMGIGPYCQVITLQPRYAHTKFKK